MPDSDTRSNASETRSLSALLFGALVVAAFVYRATLIHLYPTVYSWDAFTRMLDPTRLLVRHWMPIPQLPVFLTDLAGGDIVALRLVYAAIGTAAAAFVGWYSVQSQGRWAGLATLTLAATLPVFVIHTLVPYQEGSLVLCLFIFLCFWNRDPSEMSRHARVIAATSLALACLCRYEAWVFAGLFALRPIWERRFRELWIFVPSAVAIGWWLFILQTLDTTNPMATAPPIGILQAASTPWHRVALAFLLSADGLQYVGLLLAILGAVVAFRRGGLLGRELLVFWVVLFALTAYRAVESPQVTGRMTLLPIVLATVYIPASLAFLAQRIDLAFGPRIAALGGTAIVVALAFSFGLSTRDVLNHETHVFAQEREVALYLEGLAAKQGPNLRVGIVPRPIQNVWGESTLKTIFGQSMTLRPDDPRWVLGLDRVRADEANLDQIIVFDPTSSRYRILRPGDFAPEPARPKPLASVQRR